MCKICKTNVADVSGDMINFHEVRFIVELRTMLSSAVVFVLYLHKIELGCLAT